MTNSDKRNLVDIPARVHGVDPEYAHLTGLRLVARLQVDLGYADADALAAVSRVLGESKRRSAARYEPSAARERCLRAGGVFLERLNVSDQQHVSAIIKAGKQADDP